jgi:hypothetical protein
MYSKFLIFLIIICTFSCTFSSTYVDRPEDIKEGKQFIDAFYKNLSQHNYNSLDLMASDTLTKIAGNNVISKLTKFVNGKVGDYVIHTVIDSNSKRVTGSNDVIYYNFKIKVNYKKGSVGEILSLEKFKGSDIKIISYHAYSDLLMH